MADTGKQSPLGVNALSSFLQNKGLYINPKVPRFMGISRTNDEYIWSWWRNNDPSGIYPANPVESTVPGNTGGNDTGKIIEDTVLRLLTWAINDGFLRNKPINYDNLIYMGSDINASITITNSGWPAGANSPSNQPTTALNRGICTIPALGNAKPPTYQPFDPANRWNKENPYAGLQAAPANTGWPMSGADGQKQGASWFPYKSGGPNKSITQWGYFRLHYLQAWGEFKYNDPEPSSPYNYFAPYTTASYPPKYKDFCASFLSADAWKNYSNQAIYSMFNSQEFLKGAYSGINDLISGDIAGINTAFTWFGEDLRLLGKAFNVKTIDKFGYPSNLLATIVENNAMTQELALALDAVQISTADIDNFMSGSVIPSVEQEKLIYSAFLTIKGQNLEPILRVLNCRAFNFYNGTNEVVEDDVYLTDLLSPVKMFRWSKSSLFIPIYNNNTANIQEAGSKLRIRLFPDGNSVNSELTSTGVTENVGQLITDGSPPIITQDLNTTITEPQKGFNSRLQSIIPRDDAIACTALSYAFSQVTNIQQSDNEFFAQAVKRLEAVDLNLFTRVNGTNNYTPVNVPIAQKGHFLTASGSGPRGTFTMSDMFGSMSSLPYPWETIYEKIRKIAWNPGVGNSIRTTEPNAGLFYIYKQLFLALTWAPAIHYVYQWPIDLRKGCDTPYVDGACLNLYQGKKSYGVAEIGSKGLVGIRPGMQIKSIGSTTQWTWNYIAGNPYVKTPIKPKPPPVPADAPPMPEPNGPPCYNWSSSANAWVQVECLAGDPGGPPLTIYEGSENNEGGSRIEIVRDPGTDPEIGSGELYKLFEDPIWRNAPSLMRDKTVGIYNREQWVIEYPWRGHIFYDINITMPRRKNYTFDLELFCDRKIKSWPTAGGWNPVDLPITGNPVTVQGETTWRASPNPVVQTTVPLEVYYQQMQGAGYSAAYTAGWSKNIIFVPQGGIAFEINMELYPIDSESYAHKFGFVAVPGNTPSSAQFQYSFSPYPGDYTIVDAAVYGTPQQVGTEFNASVWFLTDYWGTQAKSGKSGGDPLVNPPGQNRLPSRLTKYYLNIRSLNSGSGAFLSMSTNLYTTKANLPRLFNPCNYRVFLEGEGLSTLLIDTYVSNYAGCGPGGRTTSSDPGSGDCPTFNGPTIVWEGSQIVTPVGSAITAFQINTSSGPGVYLISLLNAAQSNSEFEATTSLCPGQMTATSGGCSSKGSGTSMRVVVGRPLQGIELQIPTNYCHFPSMPTSGNIYLNVRVTAVQPGLSTRLAFNVSPPVGGSPSASLATPAAAARTSMLSGSSDTTAVSDALGAAGMPKGMSPGAADEDPESDVLTGKGYSHDFIFPTRGLENGGGYLRGKLDAAAEDEDGAQFGGPKTVVFPEYRNISGAQAYVKRMGCFDTTAQSNEYGRFGRVTRFAVRTSRIWYYIDKMFQYPDGRSLPTNRYWSSGRFGPGLGGNGPVRPGFPPLGIPPQTEGIYSTGNPKGIWTNTQPPFTEIWWNLDPFNDGEPDFLWGNCYLPNEGAQIPPWRLYIKCEKPPIELLPVYIKEDVGGAYTRTSDDGENVEGDWYTMGGVGHAAGAPGILVKSFNNAWENGDMPKAVAAYIAQANKEIKRIYNARNASDPNDPVNQLNTLYEYCGTQLMIEQRTRYYALPPVPVPYDDFLNAWPTPIYSFVDSLPMLHQDTAPHMTSQTLDYISDLDGGSDTLNPVYDSTQHGVLGGQSTIVMGPQERNQQRLGIIGIPLSNNIENYIQPEERMVWTMNNTIAQATNNQSTPGGDYVITSWPGYVQPGGERIAPIPQGRFIERPVPSVTVIPGQASGSAGTPGPWPQVGTLITGPGPGPGQDIPPTTVLITENTNPIRPYTLGRGTPNEVGTVTTVNRLDPEVIYDRNSSSRRPPRIRRRVVDQEPIDNPIGSNPINPIETQPYNPGNNSINYPIRLPNFSGAGGTPRGGLGDTINPNLITGVGYTSIIPVNLDPFFTGTTTFPSSLSVEQAIAQVIACNCDCFIN